MGQKMKHSYVDDVAARLRQTREAFRMKPSEFADNAGIARNAYAQYESGQRLPRLDIAIKLCSTYGLTLDWIFRGEMAGLPFNVAKTLQDHPAKSLAAAE